MKPMFLILSLLFLSEISIAQTVSIACDRIKIEDEGPIVLNFTAGVGSELKNLEEGCGGEGPCSNSRYFNSTFSQSSGEWPLGTYAGHNSKWGSFVVILTQRVSPPRPYAQFIGQAVEISSVKGYEPFTSIDEIDCYQFTND